MLQISGGFSTRTPLWAPIGKLDRSNIGVGQTIGRDLSGAGVATGFTHEGSYHRGV